MTNPTTKPTPGHGGDTLNNRETHGSDSGRRNRGTVRIRALSDADFEPVARMLGAMWHAQHGEESFWQGADELCDHLAQSDQGFVAVDDAGEPCGVVLLAAAESSNRSLWRRERWVRERERIFAEAAAQGVDSRADEVYLDEENALMRRAGEELGTAGVGEVVLLVVWESARGTGLGRALWEKGTAWLTAHGTRAVRLVTDDECDWEFYEHLGLRRVLSENYSTEDDFGMYVYEGNLG